MGIDFAMLQDVDTPEPDEKSIITYVSCLYDAFPEPPSIHPLAIADANRRLEEYKEFARRLYVWIQESLTALQNKKVPSTLEELKNALAETSRFRNEQIPPRLKDKHTCGHLWREIEKLIGDMSRVGIDEDIRISNIERMWTKLINALNDREKWLTDEVGQSDKLHRLAEKILRECRQAESKLDEIEERLEEEIRRADRLHPDDLKANCRQIESELEHSHEMIQSMLKDCQKLRDGRYPQAGDVQRKVQKVSERWASIRVTFHELVNSPRMTQPIQEEPAPLSLDELIATNEHFHFLNDCLVWVKQKLEEMENAEYGSDLPGVKRELEKHRTEHRKVDQFQAKIERCTSAKHNFRGEEASLYSQLLIQVTRNYSELLVTSNKRMSDLESLQDFIQSATTELIWLNEKEEAEIRRDWGARNLDLVEIEQYYENLMGELEKREVKVNAVQSRGESLVLAGHPAATTLQAYLTALRTQWSWVLQLTLCLEFHLHHASAYHRFFLEANDCQQWIAQQDEELTTTFSKSDFTLEEGEQLMKKMQDLRDNLSHNGEVVEALVNRSKEILPLKLRKERLSRPMSVTAICQCKTNNLSIQKQEECVVRENSNIAKWRVTNSSGAEGEVPSVCFLVPPPNQEAIDVALRLQQAYDRCIATWQKKQHRMRQNMIFATIKVVLAWTFEQVLWYSIYERDARIYYTPCSLDVS
ncbi:unnamed protein product [Notodromas monacha]|uniref:SH3 domain-containing protein n=1 Tax=Notodromas monacha TaxID=399045 RepID=A0A7R9G7R2_9CRUS|nr:unnamed protein product [Notodromas monacha]CAG0912336.1 unnamed protein product [Notodromas monacha]